MEQHGMKRARENSDAADEEEEGFDMPAPSPRPEKRARKAKTYEYVFVDKHSADSIACDDKEFGDEFFYALKNVDHDVRSKILAHFIDEDKLPEDLSDDVKDVCTRAHANPTFGVDTRDNWAEFDKPRLVYVEFD